MINFNDFTRVNQNIDNYAKVANHPLRYEDLINAQSMLIPEETVDQMNKKLFKCTREQILEACKKIHPEMFI